MVLERPRLKSNDLPCRKTNYSINHLGKLWGVMGGQEQREPSRLSRTRGATRGVSPSCIPDPRCPGCSLPAWALTPRAGLADQSPFPALSLSLPLCRSSGSSLFNTTLTLHSPAQEPPVAPDGSCVITSKCLSVASEPNY